MKKRYLIIFIVVGIILSCAPGSNDMLKSPDAEGNLAGFFSGLWHGFILLFSFIASLFSDNVNIYEVHNVGPLYNLGFLIGVSSFFGGSGSASKKKWKNK